MRFNWPLLWLIFFSMTSAVAQTATDATRCSNFLSDAFFESTPFVALRECISTAAVDARDATGRTALHIAVSVSDNPAIIRALLLRGWDVSLRDAENLTVLHRAAEFAQNAGFISDLISYGAIVDERIDPASNYLFQTTGVTALFIAASRPDAWEIVAALIAAGADVNATDANRRRPLHAAAIADQDGWTTGLLLRAGADPNAADVIGITGLHLAAEKNHFPIVSQLLVVSGASPDAQNDLEQTPLQMAAAFSPSEEIFSLLFMAAKTPCLLDSAGRSAVTNAQQNNALKGTDTYWQLHQFCATAN